MAASQVAEMRRSKLPGGPTNSHSCGGVDNRRCSSCYKTAERKTAPLLTKYDADRKGRAIVAGFSHSNGQVPRPFLLLLPLPKHQFSWAVELGSSAQRAAAEYASIRFDVLAPACRVLVRTQMQPRAAWWHRLAICVFYDCETKLENII